MNLDHNLSIVNSSGAPSDSFRFWAAHVSRNMPVIGEGSPEGVVSALKYSLYIDESNPLTPIQYRKMLDSVSGDKLKGWALI